MNDRTPNPVPRPRFGITGWKNTGKTTLLAALCEEMSGRGLRISTLKHTHHHFDIDRKGSDSWRHRQAGTGQVMIASAHRRALMTESGDTPEPALDDLIAEMALADLFLVEGWKWAPHPKLECVTKAAIEAGRLPRAMDDPAILAVASDVSLPDFGGAVFDRDDVSRIAEFVLRHASPA